MYTQFFNLTQAPFSIAPDPRYLFMSERHREALAHLLYGVDSGGGFVLLTGEIGAGKTTICRCFLAQVPADCDVAYIFNPKLTVRELLQSICAEFRIAHRHDNTDMASVKHLVDALTRHLLDAHAAGRNSVLIIDEAQNLSPDVLEQLRLLTNLETSERKLLQIILIGQPELRTMLARPELEQLAQRIIARYHLDSLSAAETAGYIRHRLAIAGTAGGPLFPSPLAQQIHRITHGVPRRINLLCDRALLGAYAEGKRQVNRNIVVKAATEIFGPHPHSPRLRSPRWRPAFWGALAGAALAGATVWAIAHGWHGPAAAPQSAVAAVPAASPSANAPAAMPVKATAIAAPLSPPSPLSALPDAGSAGTITPWSRNDAIRQLAQLWKIAPDQDLPCQVGQQSDLHCYIRDGVMLDEIRRLDRPAVLTLREENDKVGYALLVGLTDTRATVRVDGATRTISATDLMQRFNGGFVTLWRAPGHFRDIISLGQRGEEVDWTAAQLARLNGENAPARNLTFDQDMRQQIEAFQRKQGMKADGIIGPRTFMLLNRVAGLTEPYLRDRATATPVPAGE